MKKVNGKSTKFALLPDYKNRILIADNQHYIIKDVNIAENTITVKRLSLLRRFLNLFCKKFSI